VLTKERLLEVLEFDQSISRFRWREREGNLPFNAQFAGKLAGGVGKSTTPGLIYRRIQFDGVQYKEHRLVWLYWHGELPEFDLDHLNGDGLDNRIENLRLDRDGVNMRNMAKNVRNTSGYTNVSWRKKRQKWEVHVKRKNIHVHGGYFALDELDKAILKAAELREKLGFSPLHGLTREERKVKPAPDV
jgi:hypothetical protein